MKRKLFYLVLLLGFSATVSSAEHPCREGAEMGKTAAATASTQLEKMDAQPASSDYVFPVQSIFSLW